MRRVSARTVIVMTALAASLVVPAASFAAVVPMSLSQLSAASDAVVRVSVLADRSRGVGRGTRDVPVDTIVTDSVLAVRRTYKGARPDRFTLTQPGGIAKGFTLDVSDVPDLSPGQQAVLFLDEHGVVGGVQGCLLIEGDEIPALGMTLAELERAIVVSDAGSPAIADTPSGGLSDVSASGVGVESIGIDTITPALANSGTGETVTITGSNFGSSKGTVWFMRGTSFAINTDADRVQAKVVAWTPTSIVAEVPPNAQPGNLQVRSAVGSDAFSKRYELGFSYLGYKWPSSGVRYRINANTSDTTGEADAIRRAMHTWSQCGSVFHLDYTGTSSMTANDVRTDGANDIFFTSGLPAGYLAMNQLWYDDTKKEFLESNLMFSDDFAWGHGSSGSYWDVETVALHELGHTVGLADQYASTDRVMGAGALGIVRRSLTTPEINGAVHIYGSSTSARMSLGGSAKLTPAFGKPAYVSVRLYDRYGGILPDRKVGLFTSAGSQVATLTGSVSDPGLYYGSAPLVRTKTPYVASFWGDDVSGPTWLSVTVKPKAKLSVNAPEKNRAYRSFAIKGSIAPAHGRAKVTFEIWKRRSSGSYYKYKNYSVTTSKSGYSKSVKLGPGTYRVRTKHADGSHASSASSYDTFKVR